jgi:hypothetical protein
METITQNQEQETKTQNPNMFYLWWLNKNTQKLFCAGRAFYSENTGDFSLMINLLETSTGGNKKDGIYLRPIQSNESHVYFRVEKVIHKGDRSHRFLIGEGFQSIETDGDIHIHLEPLTSFNKKLVLTMTPKKDETNA